MIKILFPPGCYGTYLAKCIYNFSNLRQHQFENFVFSNGSSHDHRYNSQARRVIVQGHTTNLTVDNSDKVVTLLPSKNHFLDYYNNQFYKQQRGHLVEYITGQITQTEAEHKLRIRWNYAGSLDNAPNWIMREWCSFWIQDVLHDSYNNIKDYTEVKSVYSATTQDLFDNFERTLQEILHALDLTLSLDLDTIQKQHTKFLTAQKFHNSQVRCTQAIENFLIGVNADIVVHSLFDEAYIQHLLRSNGIELMCDSLNNFPTTIAQLKNITYEASNNRNT